MNKFKKVMLGALSVLTLGLFVATGARVDATSYAQYGSCTGTEANRVWDFTVTKPSTNVEAKSGDELVGGIIVTASTVKVNKSGYLSVTSGTILIPVMEDSKGSVSMTVNGDNKTRYMSLNNGTSSDSKIFMGSGGGSISYSSNQITTYNNQKYLSFTGNVGECKVETITVTSESDSKVFTGLTVSNSTTYNVGDTFSTSGLTVTANYDDESSGTLTSGYTTEFSPALVDGKFSTATTYTLTVTVTLGGVEKSATTDIVVTETQKWTVTYYDANGDSHTAEIKDKEAFTTTVTKTNSKFLGWSETENSSVADANVTSITKDITLYPVFASVVTLTKNVEKTFTLSSVTQDGTTNNWFASDMSLILSSNNNKVTINNNKISLGTNGSNGFVGFVVPANTLVKVSMQLVLGSDKNTNVKVAGSTDMSINLATKSAVVNKDFVVSNTTDSPMMIKITRENGTNDEAGTVTINSLKVIASDSVAVFNCQYDTATPADATKIRFIVTIDGVADVTTIDTVTFTIKVGEVTREFKCTQLYTSISNKYTGFGAATGRYYAVYALNNIQTAIDSGATFASMSVTVTFTTESGLNPITASHAGFKLGTKGE